MLLEVTFFKAPISLSYQEILFKLFEQNKWIIAFIISLAFLILLTLVGILLLLS